MSQKHLAVAVRKLVAARAHLENPPVSVHHDDLVARRDEALENSLKALARCFRRDLTVEFRDSQSLVLHTVCTFGKNLGAMLTRFGGIAVPTFGKRLYVNLQMADKCEISTEAAQQMVLDFAVDRWEHAFESRPRPAFEPRTA